MSGSVYMQVGFDVRISGFRFGKVFFKVNRELSADELQGAFLVNNVEKDGLIDVSKKFVSVFWTFITA